MTTSNELLIPALRAHMGDWVYYVTFLQMEEIARRVHIAEEIHSSPILKTMVQRQIAQRAGEISDYLLNQPQRFFNALIVGVYGGAPDWYELGIGTNRHFDAEELPLYLEGALGILRLDGAETLFAIDGRHRIEGIKKALAESEALNREEVSVIFVSHRKDPAGLERTRRLCTTLNRTAKRRSKSEIIAQDENDIIAITTRELVENHPLFQENISLATTKTLAADNRNWTTITTLYDVLDILFRREKGWEKFKQHRPADSILAEFYTKSELFWNTLADNFPPLNEVLSSRSDAKVARRYRHNSGGHLLFRPIGLLIIAHVVRQAKNFGGCERETVRRISELPMELADAPWTGLLWDETQCRMITAKPNRKVAEKICLYQIGGNVAREKLRWEYAGLCNITASEVELTRAYTSLPSCTEYHAQSYD